jgi:MoxR-like ATPase/predicted RNA-binding protein with PUA-like domain
VDVETDQANRLAFELGKTILDYAQDFEIEIAEQTVVVTVQPEPYSGPIKKDLPLMGLGPEQTQNWPPRIHVKCEWEGGSVSLEATLSHWSKNDKGYPGQIGLRVRNGKVGGEIVWRTLSSTFFNAIEGKDVPVKLRLLPGNLAAPNHETPSLKQLRKETFRNLVRDSGPREISPAWFSLGSCRVMGNTIECDGKAIFKNLIVFALCKTTFHHRRLSDDPKHHTVEGSPLVDFNALTALNMDETTIANSTNDLGQQKLSMWEAAYWVLREKEPLRSEKIWKAINSRNWHESQGETPAATLHANLIRRSMEYGGVRKVKGQAHFTNTGVNQWKLTEWGRANPPCSRPEPAPTSSDEALRNALGLDRLMGVTPLPGGTDQYKHTLDFVLTALGESAMNRKELVGLLNDHFGPLSPQYTRQNIRLLGHLGFIDEKGEAIQLSDQGATYIANPSTDALFNVFDQSYSGILATLVFAERNQHLTTNKAHQYINRTLQKGWQTQAQSNRRLRWLHSAGALAKTSTAFVLTDAGKAILQSRREDADLILNHLDQSSDVRHTLPTCWIFQANPNRWDAKTALRELSETKFEVNQHKDKIKAGHKVFFWISGKGGGVTAYGTVLSDPVEMEPVSSKYDAEDWAGDERKIRTQVRIDHFLEDPISRGEVKACEGLQNLQILKMSQGSNFKVTAEEAEILAELYEDRGGALCARELDGTSPEADTFKFERSDWSSALLDQCKSWGLPHVTNLVLEGVPGTGKTYAIKQITKADTTDVLQGRGEGRHAITLHPATSYEDFVEGLRPGVAKEEPWRAEVSAEYQVVDVSGFGHSKPDWFFENPSENDGGSRENDDRSQASNFTIHDGFFLRVCREAIHFPHKDFLVLLDEINRCNVPKVLGDLLTTLERAKRATWDSSNQHWDLSKAQVVTLPYSKRAFFVPDNVFVVATMNTTDRSVAPLDAALRRRFGFYRVWPMGFQDPSVDLRKEKPTDRHNHVLTPTDLLNRDSPKGKGGGSVAAVDLLLSKLGEGKKKDAKEWLRRSVVTWVSLNAALLVDLGPDAMLGHSYLFDMADDLNAEDSDPRWRGDAEKSHAIISRHWSRYMLPQLADVLVSNNRIDLADRSNSQNESSLWKVLNDLRRSSGGLWGKGFHSTIEGTGLNRMPVFQLDAPSTIPEVKKDNPSVADEDSQNVETLHEGVEE